MKKRLVLDRVTTADGSELTLCEHDGSFTICIDNRELMSTRQFDSEQVLATATCARLKSPKPRILIGGLGFGYTLGAALRSLPKQARVVVCELFGAVIAWNRDERIALPHLKAPRVEVVESDIVRYLESDGSVFDAILLDVDNGPSAFTAASNSQLYQGRGLALLQRKLVAGGWLAVWSATADPAFEKAMRRAGYEVEVMSTPARNTSGRKHTLFFGRTRS